MLQKIQATRFEELVEKLKTIVITLDQHASPPDDSRLSRADRVALATESIRLQIQLDLLNTEMERNHTDIHWRGHGDMAPLEASASFDQSQVEMTCIQLREQKILAEIWIAQSRGINTCWQIADRLNRAYRGHGYVTMQPHLTERDLRVNREVANSIIEEADRGLIDAAFAVAAVLNGMGGPERTWDHEWMSTDQRIGIISECFRLLRLVLERNLPHHAHHPAPTGIPRTAEEVFLM